MTHVIDETQRKWAKVVGAAYLFALVPAIFAEFYVTGKLIVYDNAAEWLRSGYIPKALAALGIFGSVVIGACTFAFIVFPGLAKVVTVTYYAPPIFLFELTMGFWLLLVGLRRSPTTEAQ